MAEATYPLYPDGLTSEAPSTDGVPLGSGLTDELGAALPMKTDHTAEAISHFIEQYKRKPRMENFLSAFTEQLQELEAVFYALFTQRDLANAVGIQLDRLGTIVKEERQDRTDDAYRRMIGVRILINKSSGRVEDIYKIIRAALGPSTVVARIQEAFPAAFTVRIYSGFGDLDLDSLARALRQAKPVGVRMDVVDDSTLDKFMWTAEPDASDTTHGWGEEGDRTVGGDWADVV